MEMKSIQGGYGKGTGSKSDRGKGLSTGLIDKRRPLELNPDAVEAEWR